MGALQAFNDSDLGVATATALHTLGALGFLGGTIAYLAWHRFLRRGHDHAGLLRGAAFTTYLSIATNLLGGFLRTYESDHPHLTALATSPWVQAIVVKHLFLFTAMGAAILLFERTAPRLRRAAAEGRLGQVSHTGHRVGATLVLLGIAVAAILGSVSQVVADQPAPPAADAAPPATETPHNFTGVLTGNPVAAHAGGAFVVPQNATTLRFTADAGSAPAVTITLTAPDGTAQTLASGSVAILQHPAAGAWHFDLDTPVGTGSPWTASARVTVGGAAHMH